MMMYSKVLRRTWVQNIDVRQEWQYSRDKLQEIIPSVFREEGDNGQISDNLKEDIIVLCMLGECRNHNGDG